MCSSIESETFEYDSSLSSPGVVIYSSLLVNRTAHLPSTSPSHAPPAPTLAHIALYVLPLVLRGPLPFSRGQKFAALQVANFRTAQVLELVVLSLSPSYTLDPAYLIAFGRRTSSWKITHEHPMILTRSRILQNTLIPERRFGRIMGQTDVNRCLMGTVLTFCSDTGLIHRGKPLASLQNRAYFEPRRIWPR